MARAKDIVAAWAAAAGISIDGSRDFDLKVNDDRFYRRVVSEGSLGLGESYMDEWWDCRCLSGLFQRVLASNLRQKIGLSFPQKFHMLRAKLSNMQTVKRAQQVAHVHYNLGNEFFKRMLDRRMVYSCGYWEGVSSLDDAQERKLDLICRKLRLSERDQVLDIGCGWGSFVKFAAERYGCACVGVTISERQAEYARLNCARLPVEIILADYRDYARRGSRFSRIVSIGMLEHVGPANYRTFARIVEGMLKDDGLCLIQTIGDNESAARSEPWLNRYIFPNGVAPSVQQLARAFEGRVLVEDWHNFGPDYYKTFAAWCNNFRKNWSPETVRTAMDTRRFFRMWDYYLHSFGAAFAVRHLQLWQIVLSKAGGVPEYRSIR